MLLRQTAVGVDYIDVYVRTGLYPRPLPTGMVSRRPASSPPLGPRRAGL